MRTNIFFLSDDPKFFYKLNKELTLLNVKVKILNFGNKVPNRPCLILTTSEELSKIKNPNEKIVKILSYNKKVGIEKFVIRVLAAFRIGYKNEYSEITFSVDPGTKHIGLAMFLDDYYLNSHTFYDVDSLIQKINDYVEIFQDNKEGLLDLIFKFGMGILPTTLELVSNLFTHFKDRQKMKVFLIDESKTSKMRIFVDKRKIPKDEVSALILVLREGIEINRENYVKIFNGIKNNKIKLIPYNYLHHDENGDKTEILKQIIINLLKGDTSLRKSSELLK